MSAIPKEPVIPTVKLTYSFPAKKPVQAVTTLGKELYVSYQDQPYIAVYDIETFSLQHERPLSVEGLGNVSDMASCRSSQCIYIADEEKKKIHKVFRAKNEQQEFGLGLDTPHGLSVNSKLYVIVTCKVDKFMVLQPDYELVFRLLKEINLQPGIENPRHTIQLTERHYVVSHSGLMPKVVIVTEWDQVQQQFNPEGGLNAIQFTSPHGLAVMKKQNQDYFIFVADTGNSNGLVMLKTNCRLGEFPAPKCVSHCNPNGEPRRMWLDSSDDGTYTLYVGVNNKRNNESEKYTSGHVEVYSVS